MNRVRLIHVCLISLLSPLILCTSFTPGAAQRNPVAGRMPHGKPFVDPRAPLPSSVTLKPVRGAKTRAGQPIVAQTVDLTAGTPTVQDLNPNTAKSANVTNELPVAFQSNRGDLAGTLTGADPTLFHIYLMGQDGSGVTGLTGPLGLKDSQGNLIGSSSSQSEPALNQTGSLLVFIDTDSAGSVSLKQLNLNTHQVTTLLPNDNDGIPAVAGLNHPEYGADLVPNGLGPGVLVSVQTVAGGPYHIYSVDTVSLRTIQLTSGIADDRNPTQSPDVPSPGQPVIAFDSNRANAAGTTVKATRDVWVMSVNPNLPDVTRVTNFGNTDNVEPAWSTNKQDQPGQPQRFVRGQQLLAFASTRMATPNSPPSQTHDVYWLKTTIAADPANPSVYTVTTPENPAGNVALNLNTSDPQHQYDDRHPTWPQFITSYRVVYQTDRSHYNAGSGDSGPNGQPQDIFASTVIDINAPTLVRFDDVTGQIVDVSPRISAPGSTVTIQVKIADLESGMPLNDPVYGDGVFVQIKNPNSKYQGRDGLEHKVYAFYQFTPDNNHYVINTPVEYESEPIYIGNDPSNSNFNKYPRTNPNLAQAPRYIASIADFYAYSGLSAPPDAKWLPLKFMSRDPVTGIGTYSATWQTDVYGSDYVVDVIAYDASLNPFTQGGADRGMNWKIYDNVGGFSTQPFQPAHNILMVSDNAAGQKFFNTRFGSVSLANVWFSFWGTESWLTDIDVSLLPTQYAGNPPGPISNMLNSLGVNSYRDGVTNDGTVVDGYPVPATQQYDVWRILCRGPLPDAVLANYVPHTETQPADAIGGEKNPRTVLVAPACVMWNAPYTGDVFVGPGSLTDLAVQAQLHTFLMAGGRLLVSGQDIAWAATLDGAAGNSFISSDLHAQYVYDEVPGMLSRVEIGGQFPTLLSFSDWYRLLAAGDYNPISSDPWHGPKYIASPSHNFPGPNTSWYPISAEQEYLFAGINPANPQVYDYCSPGVQYPDAVTPTGGAVWDINYNASAGGPSAVIHFADTATSSRIVYAPMGLEGLNSHAYTVDSTLVMKNRRAELLHNAACWLRTGSIVGKVVDVEAGNPMGGVLVRLSNQMSGNSKVIAYTGITREDGTYSINGVLPDIYEVTAIKPGFTIQKPTFAYTHGGFRDDVSFRMTQAQPAVISGKVTRIDGTTPIVGATVTATDVTNPAATFSATTDANGNYSIERVPAFTKYTLTASAPGFGASIPVNYTVPDAQKDPNDTLVQAAKTYTGYDFQLKAEPGAVTGAVFVKNADGSKGAPIASATVTATMGTQSVTAVTDANGQYSFNASNTPANGLDPGAWALVASAPGYAPNSPGIQVTVITAQTVTATDILLSPVPPGSLSGLVTRTSDGSGLSGVLIQLKDQAGNIVTSTTTGPVQTANDGYRYNYSISSVPAGVTYTVVATKSGFTAVPTSQQAPVTSGNETRNVNFQMDALHTFSGLTSMVSAPYDYTGYDIAQLLSVPAGDTTNGTFLFATWDLGRYSFYPNSPANTMRSGRGYFLRYKTNLPLSIQGTAQPTDRAFDIPLNPGWNLVGDPFNLDIDWTKLKVVTATGTVLPHDQAVAQGVIGAALYTYANGGYVIDYKLSPWKGYWVRAYQVATLRIDPTTDIYGRAVPLGGGATRALFGGGTGWTINLRATAGGLHDDDNYIGVNTAAGDGFDGYKAEKPPVFGDRYVTLGVDHSNWGTHAGSYGVDVRSAAAGTKSWEFSVQTSEANSAVTVAWPNTATVGNGVSLTMTDLATGTVRDMRSSSSYTWQTGDTPGVRKFRIDVTRASRNVLAVTNVVARQASNRAAGMTIGFNLSTPADVEVRVLSPNGATVRSVTGRATRAAGINQVSWDQKNDRAITMPAGTYLVEIRAQTSDGKQSVRQVVPVVIVR